MKEGCSVFFFLQDQHTPYEERLSVLDGRTFTEQSLCKILCLVYKLVNHATIPVSLSELKSPGEMTYALGGKDIWTMPIKC